MESNEKNFITSDLSIEELRKSLEESNEILLENLKSRFTQELLASMVFFVFNETCKNKDEDTADNSLLNQNKNSTAKIFFSAWLNHTKKQSKKEMLEINNQLKTEKMNFLSAISNFSLPSTEDYQYIYDMAISDIQNLFEKNTSYK
jgi:hypothetical protein